MLVGKRIWLSIVIAWSIKLIPLLLVIFFDNEVTVTILKIANFDAVNMLKLAGTGPLLGYDQQGQPMYEGTPVHIIFALVGFLSGFIIYPCIIFVFLSVWFWLKRKRNKIS